MTYENSLQPLKQVDKGTTSRLMTTLVLHLKLKGKSENDTFSITDRLTSLHHTPSK